MHYWLLKTEPSAYSIEDLKRAKIGMWDGVRNYQARNNLRAMKKGDHVFIYHSSTDPIGIVGSGVVHKEAYPDPTQFMPKHAGFEKRSTKEKPLWYVVDIQYKKTFTHILTLSELKNDSAFSGMVATQQGSRLSVQPVSEKHFHEVLKRAS